MLQFLFDPDHSTLYHHRHPRLMQQIAAHLADAVGIRSITIEETLRGRLALLARSLRESAHVQAYAHLVASVELFHLFQIVPFDLARETQFQQLRAARLRVGSLDLKIAAIALTNHLTVLARNLGDFGRIPGLAVADWSV